MVPYFRIPAIPAGGVLIGPFLIAILAGAAVMHYRFLARLRRSGLDPGAGARMSLIVSVSTLVCAHLMVAVYEPVSFLTGERKLWDFWNGLSAMGGVCGFLLGTAIFALIDRIPAAAGLRMFEAAVYVAPSGCAVMRAGCFSVHDHPGILSNHWLAVAFPDGARWDLGLLELLFWAFLAAVFAVLDRRPRRSGFYPALTFLAYPLFRLSVLPLRYAQTSYSGLPVDGWVAMLLVPFGLWCGWRSFRPQPPEPVPQS